MAAKRVSLTKGQLGTTAGSELLNLLVAIASDGELSLGEIDELKGWIDKNKQFAEEIPAVAWLRDIIEDILRDGRITGGERTELVAAIERVLPKEQRLVAQDNRFRAEKLSKGNEASVVDEEDLNEETATERQVKYILALGGRVRNDLTKYEASDLIEELLAGSKSVSNRQMMVLRFWDKVEYAKRGRQGVSEWMDEWYAEDLMRLDAWELWKSEAGDTGGQDNPKNVPIGVGYHFLSKVQESSESRPKARREKKIGCVTLLVITVIVIAVIKWISSVL